MRLLTLEEILELHRMVLAQSGGAPGILNLNALESAVAQPLMTFDKKDLFPTLVDKVAALAFSLIQNHPFIDGNKRVGHAAMETTLMMNGFEVGADVDEQESVVLQVASGRMSREQLATWLQLRLLPGSA